MSNEERAREIVDSYYRDSALVAAIAAALDAAVAAERAGCAALVRQYGDISAAEAIERRTLDDEIAARRAAWEARHEP